MADGTNTPGPTEPRNVTNWRRVGPVRFSGPGALTGLVMLVLSYKTKNMLLTLEGYGASASSRLTTPALVWSAQLWRGGPVPGDGAHD